MSLFSFSSLGDLVEGRTNVAVVVSLYLCSMHHPCASCEFHFLSSNENSLAKDDRIGKYKNRRIGFVGMCCKHCGGQPGSGRYFPGSFNSFLSGKNAENIVDHMMKDCTACPPYVRSVLEALEEKERQMKLKPPHGSRKRFFFHIWTKLREYNGHGPDGASAILDCDLKEASTATEHGEDEQLDSTFSANQQSSCCDSLTDVAAPSASVC